ncbi:MAG: hypothetical protein WC263_02515 [Candidatus Micrarchaeia archaeon]|jgi:hypothetical protein
MAFDWRDFLRPSWEKWLLTLTVFILLLPIGVFFFFFNGSNCLPPAPAAGCGMVNLSAANLFILWYTLLRWTLIYGFQYYFVMWYSWSIALYTLLMSYLLACAIMNLFTPKPPAFIAKPARKK